MASTARNKQRIALVAAFGPDRHFLLLKRPDAVHQGGLWSLPGGKLEPDESPLAAAQRELAEETGLEGRDWRALGTHEHCYPDRALRFHLFACRIPHAPSQPEACWRWTSLAEARSLPMPAANAGLLRLIARANP